MRRLLPFLVLPLFTACGAEPSPVAVPARPPASVVAQPAPTPKPAPAPRAAADVDPVVVALGRSEPGPGTAADFPKASAGVGAMCDQGLASASALLDELRALRDAPDADLTWEATLGKLDRARQAMRNAGDFAALMAVAHPDEGVRNRAKECEPKVDKFDTAIWLDDAIAKVVKRFAAKPGAPTGPRGRLLAHVLRDFRRNGQDLGEDGKTRLRAMNEQLTKLAQEFDTNLAESHLSVLATPAELEGLPKEWREAHPAGSNGKIAVTTDYPDYFPVVTYAKDRKFALSLYKQFDNRAADKNLTVLDKILAIRAEKAKLLGYATWADYILEPRMAKDPKTVATFLDGLRKHLAKKGDAEMAEFRAMHVKLAPKGEKATLKDPIPPSDRLYLEDQVRKEKYGLDSKEVSQYFEVGKVKQGLLTITAQMFGIEYRPSKAPTWHADVEPMDVFDKKSGRLLGRFYFDLYPREGKYKHAAVFSIRDTVRLPSPRGSRTPGELEGQSPSNEKLADGSRLTPIAAIECNFPKPGGPGPALMGHPDAVTFFHEFGHVLHHVLSESELSSFAGSSVARDFVESPSQMLEEWAWAKETLDLFAVHHETGKPLPKELHAKMLRSRGFGRALATQRQLFLAALDQTYHTKKPPFDTTAVLAEINDAYTPFKYVEGTHFQASFGHLIGYDAGYYGYQWALSIAQDLFTRFKKNGLLDAKTAADYRASILAPGGSEDENAMVTRFLGRPPSDAAYRAYLLE